jgi:hypothetical protein
MPSKAKEARIEQKSYLEGKLKERLAMLAEKGLDPQMAAKDTTVRKIRAEIRATDSRLAVIESKEKKIADMAKNKADRSKSEGKEKIKKIKNKQEEPEMSKRQKKKLEKQKEKSKQKSEEGEA